MPRPRKKANRIEAKATRKGQLQAEADEKYKFLDSRRTAKVRMVSFLEYIKPYLSKIPKAITILGMTYLVKSAIDMSEELRGRMESFKAMTVGVEKATGVPIATVYGILERFGVPISVIGAGVLTVAGVEVKHEYEGLFPDWADWLISFTIAYMIVEHGGEIAMAIGEVGTKLSGLIGFLLP